MDYVLERFNDETVEDALENFRRHLTTELELLDNEIALLVDGQTTIVVNPGPGLPVREKE